MCNLAHETAGAVGTRLSLRPLFSRGPTNLQSSGEIAPRERACMHPRHCERSEAIHLSACRAMDCFVATLLAMTVIDGFAQQLRTVAMSPGVATTPSICVAHFFLNTETKNPSVPVRRGVISQPSSD